MKITEKVGDRIRLAREYKQLSSTDLAQKIGMSKQLITNWEKGRRLPTLESIISLSDTLSAPVTFLLGLNETLTAPLERNFSLKDLNQFHSDNESEAIRVPIQFVDSQSDYMVVRMKDDSMEDLLRKNDLVIIQLTDAVNDGHLVLFKINKTGQILLRRFAINNTNPAEPEMSLNPLNKAFPPIQYDEKAITILGICKDELRMIG